MRVVPVIDLKGGMVVHGVAGDRARYQPVHSVLAADAGPATVARAFSDTGVFQEVYVADLDAIAGGLPDRDAVRQIAGTGLKIWLDAGIDSIDRLRGLASFSERRDILTAVVLGLESLRETVTLRAAIAELGPSRCIFSLDLRDGLAVTRCAAWRHRSPTEIAAAAVDLGVRRMILLDVATVGTNCGPQSLELARRLRADHPHLELIGGGGVRNMDDLASLAAAGFSAALVATALHTGAIRPNDLAAGIA
jgi:phosphoribosylformimino-5-aminoimidazole carboxamide ribotide isomerase